MYIGKWPRKRHCWGAPHILQCVKQAADRIRASAGTAQDKRLGWQCRQGSAPQAFIMPVLADPVSPFPIAQNRCAQLSNTHSNGFCWICWPVPSMRQAAAKMLNRRLTRVTNTLQMYVMNFPQKAPPTFTATLATFYKTKLRQTGD